MVFAGLTPQIFCELPPYKSVDDYFQANKWDTLWDLVPAEKTRWSPAAPKKCSHQRPQVCFPEDLSKNTRKTLQNCFPRGKAVERTGKTQQDGSEQYLTHLFYWSCYSTSSAVLTISTSQQKSLYVINLQVYFS